MISGQKVLAISLIACLLVLPLGDLPVALAGKAPRDPAQTKQKVSQLGVGAEVEVVYRGGEPAAGTIQAIEDDAFVLAPTGRFGTTRFSYDEVDNILPLKLSYKASGQPDPDQARRVVAGLGVGQHARVKLTGGSVVVGPILTIEQDHFTVSASAKGQPVKIAYTEVQQVRRKPFPWYWGVAIGGAAAGTVLIWLVLSLSGD